MDAFLVRGRPWVEDLHRFPSKRLRVEFEGPDLTQETLYSVLSASNPSSVCADTA